MKQLSTVLLLFCVANLQPAYASPFYNAAQFAWRNFFPKTKPAKLADLQHAEMTLMSAFQDRISSFQHGFFEKKTSTPVQFPEASALNLFMIDKAAGYLDQWMENNEQSRDNLHCRQLSKHVLFCRPEDCKSSVERKQSSAPGGSGKSNSESAIEAYTSFIIFRPSYTAQLSTGAIFPVDEYFKESKEVASAVAEAISEHAQDQFIFVGLQGGAAVALFSAWQALIDVDQLFYNWYAYDDRLHQIKLFLFESDCILSSRTVTNFPLPAWDILRFYSPRADASTCTYEKMSHIGLPYQITGSSLKLVIDKIASKLAMETQQELNEGRNHFQNYYFGAAFSTTAPKMKSTESHEDDEVMSQISSASTARFHRSDSIRDVVPESDNDILKLIENGAKLLRKSMRLSKEFKTNVSSIYRANCRSFMQRDVDNCAYNLSTIMETAFIEKLGSGQNYQIGNGISSIQCTVEEYSILTGLAQVTCVIKGRDRAESKLIRFEASVDRTYRDNALRSSYVILGNDKLEKSSSSPAPTKATADNDSYSVFEDVRSHFTSTPFSGQNDKSHSFEVCLRDLFSQGPDGMKYLNPQESSPLTQAALSSARSIATTDAPIQNGFLSFATNLAYSQSRCNCKFTLKTTTLDYFSIYNNTPNVFFSLFWNSVKGTMLPANCENVILPPKISNSDRGNAENQLKSLAEFFSRTKGPGFTESQDTILLDGSFSAIQDKAKFVECLAGNPLDHLYNCNESVAKWAGKSVCPDYCRTSGFGSHLCSRVLACGNGLFLAFRGASVIENTVGTGGAAKEAIMKYLLEPEKRESLYLTPGCSVFSFNSTPGKFLSSTIYFAVFPGTGGVTDRSALNFQNADEHQHPVFMQEISDRDYSQVKEATMAQIYAENVAQNDQFNTKNPAKTDNPSDDDSFEEYNVTEEVDEKPASPPNVQAPRNAVVVEEEEDFFVQASVFDNSPVEVLAEVVQQGEKAVVPVVVVETPSEANTPVERFEGNNPEANNAPASTMNTSSFNTGAAVAGRSGGRNKKNNKNIK